jgi:hypothetical protein
VLRRGNRRHSAPKGHQLCTQFWWSAIIYQHPRPHSPHDEGSPDDIGAIDQACETNPNRPSLRSHGMRIKLADEFLLPNLLTFLRKEGCVAYYEGGGIEAVRPSLFGEQEATELRLVVNRWRNEHPEAKIELSD